MIDLVFSLDNREDQQKYGEIISDYLYFKTTEDFEKKIDKLPVRYKHLNFVF